MNESIFQINAAGLDTEKLVRDIQETVARKIEQGVYADARVARAERRNLAQGQGDNAFLDFYLRCLRDAAFVDISDFDIRERRPYLAPLLIGFKKCIWSLLKFYTYRLWSQQNQVNGMIVTAVEALDDKYRLRMQKLESRIAELEKR